MTEAALVKAAPRRYRRRLSITVYQPPPTARHYVTHSTPRSPRANGPKLSMKDLTVLAPQNDPFRVDTPAATATVNGLP